MPDFRYKAKDNTGKTLSGEIFAGSREDLILELERKNLTVVSLEEIEKARPSTRKILGTVSRLRGKVKTFELVILCRLLATMLHGGVPILNAMESIANEIKNPNFKKVLEHINQDLREGTTLSESFKKYPDTFSMLFTAVVEAGEKVGSLDEMLRRLSGYLEARDRLIRKMRSATTYPAFIAGFFVVAIAIVTLWLIPKFQSIYSDFGARLPTLTLLIFNISNFVVRNIALVLIVALATIFYLVFFITRTKSGKIFFDTAMLKLPLFGDVIKKAAVSKFCRTLATLLAQGIAITEALLLVGKTSGNVLIENASSKASKLVIEGETIPKALQKMGVFPPLMLQMVSVGVESGSLPELLDKTADFYEEQVDTFVSGLMSMIEPILVVSLGLVIAVVVVALYLPIFKLSSAMGGGM